MNYLIDTNVLSELRRKQPSAAVTTWFSRRPASSLYLSVLTIGEIRKGIESLAAGARRQTLTDWLEHDLPKFFSGRVLDIDSAVADHWGRMLAGAGRPVAAIDSLLAATAHTHNLLVVTRNTSDFEGLDVGLVNPWVDAG